LKNGKVTIKVCSERLKSVSFDNWAYPPNYAPRKYTGNIETDKFGTVKVEVFAGLTKESSPVLGEYGVYFYCNDRLIARGLKTPDVGFTKGLVGHPHPNISLTRVVVSLSGQAQAMPWNSSKSGINANHVVFVAIKDWLILVTKDFASLSRRWEGDWPKKVFPYTTGEIKDVIVDDFRKAKKSYGLELPPSRPRYTDLVRQANKKIAKNKPWTKGLYEGIAAVDLISKKKMDEKDRICLIILDSTLEIAFKEYLVHDSGQHYNDRALLDLFSNRHKVHSEIKKTVKLPDKVWKRIKYYYGLRCKLIHECATVGIAEGEIENFRTVVEKVLKRLFGLKFD
jgi:hypothetical protein